MAKIETPPTVTIDNLPAEELAKLRAKIEAEVLASRKEAFNKANAAREEEERVRKIRAIISRAEDVTSTAKMGLASGRPLAEVLRVLTLLSSSGQAARNTLNPRESTGGQRGRSATVLPVW